MFIRYLNLECHKNMRVILTFRLNHICLHIHLVGPCGILEFLLFELHYFLVKSLKPLKTSETNKSTQLEIVSVIYFKHYIYMHL